MGAVASPFPRAIWAQYGPFISVVATARHALFRHMRHSKLGGQICKYATQRHSIRLRNRCYGKGKREGKGPLNQEFQSLSRDCCDSIQQASHLLRKRVPSHHEERLIWLRVNTCNVPDQRRLHHGKSTATCVWWRRPVITTGRARRKHQGVDEAHRPPTCWFRWHLLISYRKVSLPHPPHPPLLLRIDPERPPARHDKDPRRFWDVSTLRVL